MSDHEHKYWVELTKATCSLCDKTPTWRVLNEARTEYVYWCEQHHDELCPNEQAHRDDALNAANEAQWYETQGYKRLD